METTRKSLKVAVLGTRGIPEVQGGVEKHCEELYPRIAALGHSVRVYARNGYIEPGRKNFNGVEVVSTFCPRRKSAEAVLHTLYGIIHSKLDKERFNLLHIHSVGPQILVPLAKAFGNKVIVTNHGQDYNRSKWGVVAKTVLRLGEWMGTRYADEVITVSKGMQYYLEQKFNRRVHYVPNGVCRPEYVAPGGYLESLGVSPGEYVLSVARLVPEKGLHDLINAFRGMDTNWRLVIAGGADHEDEYSLSLKKSAGEDPRIVMCGVVKGRDIKELYTNAGIFVLPSYHEGLPIVLLEALSYGLPILCTDIPQNREIIDVQSRLFAPGDVESIREKLKAFMESPCAWEAGYVERRLKEFDWDVIAAKINHIYLSTINTAY